MDESPIDYVCILQRDEPPIDDATVLQWYIRLFIAETFQANSAGARFHAASDRLMIYYEKHGQWVEQDQFPIRLWHLLGPAIDSLIGPKLAGIRAAHAATNAAVNRVELNITIGPHGDALPSPVIVPIAFQFDETDIVLEYCQKTLPTTPAR